MRLSLRLGIAGVVLLSALAWAPFARAQDAGSEGGTDGGAEPPPTMSPGAILAYYCGDADMQCMMAPLEFDFTHDLAPWLPDWDTGWIPDSFKALQVRFVLKIPTETRVTMSGKFRATWPEPLTIATPGDRFGGFLKIDYGLIATARGKIDVTILGQNIFWEGPLPYVPQVDFHLLGMQQFPSWAYKPDQVMVSAYTPQVRLFKINVLALAKIPKEVAEGGVELDIRGELRATYHTERMVIEPSLAPITTDSGETLHDFVGGPFVELDVHPEGRIKYDGVIHLIPAFYVEILGKDFKIPFYSYELNLTDLLKLDLAQQVNFDKVRVHVPLPDIVPFEQPAVLDFGKVAVGSGDKLAFSLKNAGEAKARAVGEVEGSKTDVFKVLSGSATISPGQSEDMVVRFTPKKEGKYAADLIIRSNDPDLPEQKILLRGQAVDPDDPVLIEKDAGTKPGLDDSPEGSTYEGDDGGCGCRTVGKGHASTSWMGLIGMAALGLARRRYRAMGTLK